MINLMPKTGVGRMFCLEKPLTETDKEVVLKDLQQQEMDSSSYAVMYDPDNNTFSVLAGNLLGEYEDGE